MTHLRQHDADATLPPAGWQTRVECVEHSFRWARMLGLEAIVAAVKGDEEKALRLSRVAARFALEGLQFSSAGR